MQVKFRPLRDKVLIKRLSPIEKSAGGLFLPSVSQAKSNQGVVVAVGSGAVTSSGEIAEMSVKVGDHVWFGKGAGQDINLAEGEFLLIKESDIAYVNEENLDL